jgi:flagellin-specific chaperone FliS
MAKRIPEDEEIDMGEEFEEDEEFEEGQDMFDALGSLLATEDGETVATSLAGLKDSTEKIAACMEMQNKILVKILSALTKTAAS